VHSFFNFLLSSCSIPDNATCFSVLLYAQTDSESHPASCSMGTGILFPLNKVVGGTWSWSPTFNFKVKNGWSYMSGIPIRPMAGIQKER
jgi:hypothetical protein